MTFVSALLASAIVEYIRLNLTMSTMLSFQPNVTIYLSQLLRKRVIQDHGVMDFFQKVRFSVKPKERVRINPRPSLLINAKPIKKEPEQKLSDQQLKYKSQYPLHFSAKFGSISDASLLVVDGHAVNALDEKSWSPLLTAAAAGRTDMIKFLIDKGAVVDAPLSNGYTALHIAAVHGHKGAALALMKYGAGINKKCKEG